MKTILLTSSGSFITEYELEFLPQPIEQMKIGYITTASNVVDDISYMERHTQRMKELGYDFEEIDIKGKNEQALKNLLKYKEIIFVEGGNTFYLLKAVRESGFDKVIKDLMAKGVIYMGSSAGTYIACPTIEMATWKHQDQDNHYGMIDLTALNLVPFLITVHYEPRYKKFLKEKARESKYLVKILNDQQAILIQDGAIKLIGKGQEIQLNLHRKNKRK